MKESFKDLAVTFVALLLLIFAVPFFLVGYIIAILGIFYRSGYSCAIKDAEKLDDFMNKDLNECW